MHLHNSFLEFYDVNELGTQSPDPGVVPLPLQPGDVLTAQAPVVSTSLTPAALAGATLSLMAYAGGGWMVVLAGVLAITPVGTTATVNPAGQPLPTVADGVYHLGIVSAAGLLLALSNPLHVRAKTDNTRCVRYRNSLSAYGFDYIDPTYLHYLRLPLRVDRPQYLPRDAPYLSATGQPLTLTLRLLKQFALTTDYLSPAHLEALALALRHDRLELYDPETQTWDAYTLVGALKLTWQENPAFTLGRAEGTLQLTNYSLDAVTSPAATGDFNTDFGFDFYL